MLLATYYAPPVYGSYTFPTYAKTIGWMLAFGPVSFIPLTMLWQFCRKVGSFKVSLQPPSTFPDVPVTECATMAYQINVTSEFFISYSIPVSRASYWQNIIHFVQSFCPIQEGKKVWNAIIIMNEYLHCDLILHVIFNICILTYLVTSFSEF